MVNRNRVQIQLDVPRWIVINHNAMAEIEEIIHTDLALQLSKGEAPFSTVRAAVFCGLMECHPEFQMLDRQIGLRRVGAMMEEAPGETTPDKLRYLLGKVSEAIIKGMNIKEKDTKEEDEAAKKANPTQATIGS